MKPYAFDALSALLLVLAAVRVVDRPTGRRWAALVLLSGVAPPLFSASVLAVALPVLAWTSWRAWWPSAGRPGHRWAAVALPSAYAAVMGLYALVVLSAVPPSLRTYWVGHYVRGLDSGVFVLEQFAAGIFFTSGFPGVVLLGALAAGVWWARPVVAPPLLGPVAVAFGLAVAGPSALRRRAHRRLPVPLCGARPGPRRSRGGSR